MLNKFICAFWLCVIILIAIFYTYGGTPFLKKTYKIEAWWAKKNVRCNRFEHGFESILERIIMDYGSLSNQFVIKKKNGDISSCLTGNNVKENTRFRYASLTKPVTAALFFEYEKNNIVNRDALLKDYIYINHPKDLNVMHIKLKNLLTHTSGFNRLRSQDDLIKAGKKSWCPYDMNNINHLKLDHKPNTIFSYDNRNYCLLAKVLEKKLNLSYEKMLTNYLALHNFNNIKLLKGPFMADEVKYDFRNEEYFFPSYVNKFDFYAMQSVAGLSGSAIDYAELMHYFLYKRNLPLTQHVGDYKNTRNEVISTSLAFREKKLKNGELIFYHTGALPGARSLVLLRENGDIIVWLGSGAPDNSKLDTVSLIDIIVNITM